jgi:predicted amidohydrolase YtcJ
MADKPDLVIHNVQALTMDRGIIQANVVGIREGHLVHVGNESSIEFLIDVDTRIIDGQGLLLTPGLIDPHLHLLSWANHLSSVDCSPDAVSSIGEIKAAISKAAMKSPPGTWIRAVGYDEFSLTEKRHLNRHDLDSAAPLHPVRLAHRSGHILVLNTLGLMNTNIRIDTEEPLGSTIDREIPSGEPSGLLIDMDVSIRDRIPEIPKPHISQRLSEISDSLYSSGVTFVQDASAINDYAVWRDFLGYREQGILKVAGSMMVNGSKTAEFWHHNLRFGESNDEWYVGAAKIIVSDVGGKMYPDLPELKGLVQQIDKMGFQIAIHAVTDTEIEHALIAFRELKDRPQLHPKQRHRIEHASLCPPELLKQIKDLELGVVTQPGFMFFNGDRYRETVEETSQRWLYRATTFYKEGIIVASSSDAPVIPENPQFGLYAAVARKSITGHHVGESRGLQFHEALALFTKNAAYLTFQDHQRGSLSPNKRADLVLWNKELAVLQDPDEIRQLEPLMTIANGDFVFEA